MLRVRNMEMGRFYIVEHRADGVKKFRMEMHRANALAAVMYVWKGEDGKTMWRPWCFIADRKHVNNMIRAYRKDGERVFGECQGIRLNMYFAECKVLLRFFTEQGYKVTCFYKQPKNK